MGGRAHKKPAPRRSGASSAPEIPGSQWGVRLTPAENKVLQLLRMGKVYKEIASELGIAVRTVRFQAAVIRGKFGVSSTLELLQKVGFVDPKSVI
jgi:DNA-binding CsgD family transcriptional regulator